MEHLLFSLTHTLTCTCCYDEIKGIQDHKIHSHADSLILSSHHSNVATRLYFIVSGLHSQYEFAVASVLFNNQYTDSYIVSQSAAFTVPIE